ncbi:hypothetical protein ACFL14_01015 [Patescibacteria group bacterium]
MKLRSFTITELLIALAIFAILASSIIYVIIDALESSRASKDRSIASNLGQEGLEIVRNIRNRDYSSLVNGTYGLVFSGNEWTLSPTPELIQDRFTREIIISDYATNEKLINSKISWQLRPGRNLNINFESILSNWKGSAPTIPSWTNPYLASTLDLPGNSNGLQIDVVDNLAYIVRSNGTINEFVIVDVSIPNNPQMLGSIDLGASGKDVVVSEDYAYVATDHNSQELTVINISNSSNPQIIGSYDAPKNANTYSVNIQDSTVYLGRASSNGDELFSIDVSDPSSPTLLDSINLNGAARSIELLSNYAYVANSFDNQELQIINISDPNNISIISSYDVGGNQDAYSVKIIDQNNLLLGRSNNNDGSELYILDISDVNNINEISNFNSNQRINDIAYSSSNSLSFFSNRIQFCRISNNK